MSRGAFDTGTYAYDDFHQHMQREPDSGPNNDSLWTAIYTASDERLAIFTAGDSTRRSRWSLRARSSVATS